jgi:hypothetical protein
MTRTRTRTLPALAGLLLAGSGVVACAPDAPDAAPGTADADPTTAVSPSAPSTSTATSTASSTGTARPSRPTSTGPFGRSALAFFDDCPALLAHLQAEAGERVTAYGLGGGWWYGPAEGDLVATTAAAEESASDGSGRAAAPQAGVDYSTTNTQEAGVDEGDVVETDGVHVFTAVQDGLRVVEVASAEVVARTPLPAGDHQLLLAGDRLVVASQGWTSAEDTIVSVFDVTDPSDPQLLRRTHLEGRLVASRAADGTVRLVLSSSLQQRLAFVQPRMFGLDEERALEQNRRIVEESSVQDWLPRWFDEDVASGAFGEMQPALDCRDVAAPSVFSGLGVSWIASIDLDADSVPVGSAGIVSTGETVYASASSLYVATVPWDWQAMPVDVQDDGQRDDGPPPTFVHAFSLGEGAGATYRASGAVDGVLLNQFAMSEHEGTLRVATTVTDWTDGDSESFVHTIAADTMSPIASIGGLGLGEQIYAVRYLGPTAYVVTFRQIDPLYVLDLSDPAAPALQGELKIPGYSAYLHPVGEGLLLGVGQDATDEGRALGTQLSLFDVSDPTSPQRISTLSIGGWSDVEWDHRAFLYWPQDGTIVLPASPGWSECGDGQQVAPDCLASRITSPSGGVVVARLVDRALEPVGVIEHDAQGSSGCWNPLRRSIVIGSELVTVGLDQVRFSDRVTLAERATARWGDAEQYGCAWYVEG